MMVQEYILLFSSYTQLKLRSLNSYVSIFTGEKGIGRDQCRNQPLATCEKIQDQWAIRGAIKQSNVSSSYVYNGTFMLDN